MRNRALIILAGVLLAAGPARGFELDSLLPDDIPGYGTPFGVTNFARLRRVDNATGIQIGGLTIDPGLAIGAGYDSAPDGAQPGSALAQETPSLAVADPQWGLGAYLAGMLQQYPETAGQNTAGGVAALGEEMVLPRETIALGGVYIRAQETGFALTTQAVSRPVAFSLADARARDAVSLGMFTLTPEVSVSNYWFAALAGQNRTDSREALTGEFAPGGPGHLVLRLQAAQSAYQTRAFNADTNAVLAGVQDDAAGIYTIRFLAGAAQRQAADTGTVTAPVLEASLDWRPSDLDRLRLRLAREIDDPDQVSAQPYTLNEARLSLAHEYLRNVILSFFGQIDHADYLHSPFRETLAYAGAGLDWHLNARLAVNANYAFNDRQANFLRAANEHVFTVGMTWTP